MLGGVLFTTACAVQPDATTLPNVSGFMDSTPESRTVGTLFSPASDAYCPGTLVLDQRTVLTTQACVSATIPSRRSTRPCGLGTFVLHVSQDPAPAICIRDYWLAPANSKFALVLLDAPEPGAAAAHADFADSVPGVLDWLTIHSDVREANGGIYRYQYRFQMINSFSLHERFNEWLNASPVFDDSGRLSWLLDGFHREMQFDVPDGEEVARHDGLALQARTWLEGEARHAVWNKFNGCDPNGPENCFSATRTQAGFSTNPAWGAELLRRLGRPTSWNPNEPWCANRESPTQGCRYYAEQPIVARGGSAWWERYASVYFATFERGQVYGYQRGGDARWWTFEIVDAPNAPFFAFYARYLTHVGEAAGTNSFLGLPDSGLEVDAQTGDPVMSFINGEGPNACRYRVRFDAGSGAYGQFVVDHVAGPTPRCAPPVTIVPAY
jgi:hypothetical protein